MTTDTSFALGTPAGYIQVAFVEAALHPTGDQYRTGIGQRTCITGWASTQSVERVWSLFKRCIVDGYHRLSVKHLPAYLDEMEWRFNNRENSHPFRDILLVLPHSDPLPYKELVAKPGAVARPQSLR